MFSRADNNSQKKTAQKMITNDVPSLLSSDLTINGDVTTEGELQLDGKITGDINCGTLTIGEKAEIHGEINAERVMVYGNVVGRICARAVELFRSAEVKGDILHETMSIEAGAYLEGMCKRMDTSDRSSAGKDGKDDGATAAATGNGGTAPGNGGASDDKEAMAAFAAQQGNAAGSNIREQALGRKAAGS